MLLAIINLFNKILLTLLHIAFFIYLKFKLLKPLVNKIIYNVNSHFSDLDARYKTESELIERTIKFYPKVPKHIVLAVGEEQIYYEDLIQIILWCFATDGISVVSFYDHKNGELLLLILLYMLLPV